MKTGNRVRSTCGCELLAPEDREVHRIQWAEWHVAPLEAKARVAEEAEMLAKWEAGMDARLVGINAMNA